MLLCFNKYLNPIAPLIAGSMISGGASMLGSIFGSSSSLKAQREANATNLKIAEMNNEAMKEMYEQQNQWNIEQWERNNEYNSIAEQMKRAREGGLNPAAVNSVDAGVSSAPAASASPPSFQQASVIPEDAFGQAFGKSISAGVQDYVAMQQARNLKLDADKKDIELPFVSQLKQGELDIQGARFNLLLRQSDLTEKQADKVGAELSLVKSEVDLTRQSLSNLKLDATRKEIDNAFEKAFNEQKLRLSKLDELQKKWNIKISEQSIKESQAKIVDLLSSASLKNAQEANTLANTGLITLDIQYKEATYPIQFNILSTQEEQQKFVFGQLQKWDDAVKYSQVITAYWNCINSTIDAIGQFLPKSITPKVKKIPGTNMPEVNQPTYNTSSTPPWN